MKKTNMRKWSSLVVLFIGTGVIFQLPYIRNTFYIPMSDSLKLTNEQFGALSGVYATISMFSYFFGGWIADMVSVRKLLTFSFLFTGIVGLWFSTFPDYGELKIIFALFGITIVYWPALVKAVRNLGDGSEQGRLFGILEGGRGVVSAAAVFALLELFDVLGGGKFGFGWVIRSYAIISIVTGIATWFIIPDDVKHNKKAEPIFMGFKRVILMPRAWLICLIIFTSYSIYGIMSFLPLYMVKLYGMSKQASVQLGGIRYIIQLIGGLTGGFLADKIGSKIKVIFASYFVLAAFLLSFILIPDRPEMLSLCLFDFILFGAIVFGIHGIYFAIIDEAKIDRNITGAVSGLASCIGYIPDMFLYTMIGRWIDMNASGFKYMFIYGIGTCLAGSVIAFFLLRNIKNISKAEKVPTKAVA